jgi:hypothetical protein
MLDASRHLALAPEILPAVHAAGLALSAAGVFLFMALVADRLIPAIGRRLSMWTLEAFVFLLFAAAVAACVLRLAGDF